MIVTLYKKTIGRLLLMAGLLVTTLLATAQQYPVQVVPRLLPPYTLSTSEYYNGTSEKLAVLLTNTDLNKPALQVRLRMSIQGQTVKLVSRDNVYYPSIQLDAGTPVRVSLGDLAPYFNADNLVFEGLTRAQYVQSGQLPEGFYQFCFEAVEVSSGQTVGRSTCAMAWMSLNDPPLLNLPVKAESIVYKDPQNIIFQWTPRNFNSAASAYNTEYEFSLVELWDNGLAPEAAFGTAQPLYTTTTQATTLLYGPSEPLLLAGHRYAWRIRAQQSNGTASTDAWRNNGYSEIYWFTCQNNCPPPSNVQHEMASGRATITWGADVKHNSFSVDYREQGQSTSTWYNSATTTSRMMLYDLKKGKTYEYRVGGTCDNGNTFVYSDIKQLQVSNSDSAGACGLLVADSSIKNRNPIQTLLTGDVITVGDFPVKLLQVSGQSTFTGAGYITVAYLAQARVKVKFTGITVNTDKQLIGGIVETTYDPKEGQIANLDELIEGGNGVGIVTTGVDTTGYYVDMVIPDASHIQVTLNTATDSTGTTTITTPGATLTITGSNGEVKEVKVESLPATIKDKNGTVYGVDAQGNVTKISERSELNMTASELNELQPDKGVVVFKSHTQQVYAFDEYQAVYAKSTLISEEYKVLAGNYYVNAKAIGEAQADVVTAIVRLKDNSLVKDSICFITGKGVRYESEVVNDSTWTVHIVGGPGNDAQELYALYPQGGGRYLSLGKLFVASYAPQTRKLVLVPVGNAVVDKEKISRELNAIYNPLAISFTVTQEVPFTDDSWDLVKDGKLAVSGSGWLTSLTDEMKALNNAYKSSHSMQSDAAYLFVLSGSDSSIAGDMPRGEQFGYLFVGNDGKVAAHEVGHGIFKLKHIFDGFGLSQGELPGNVLDYPAGDQFVKMQWDQLHSPGIVMSLFESDNDGLLTITKPDAFKDLKNAGTNTYTFLSPGGLPVTLPASASNIVLSETNYFLPSDEQQYLHTTPFGTLVSFTLTNNNQKELYTAVGSTSARSFVKYVCAACNDNKGKTYTDELSAKETSGNIILAWPCFGTSHYGQEYDGSSLDFSVKAKWFNFGEDSWKASKAQGYLCAGNFTSAEALLEKAANEQDANKNTTYEVSDAARVYSDFQNSKDANRFLYDNAVCDKMPFPALINTANLIALHPIQYAAFVSCGTSSSTQSTSSDYATDDTKMTTKEAFDAYLKAFRDYVDKGRPRLDTIKDSDDMEAALGRLCKILYPTLTMAERKQILTVLTQRSNWINGCYISDRMQCEEAQLITTVASVSDQKEAQELADFLNNNPRILYRLVKDVDDGTNHEEMMKALFDLFGKKDVHAALTADDLLGQRLFYKSKFDYGAFAITATITDVNFSTGQNGTEPAFYVAESRNQVFASGTTSEIQAKYRVNLNNNGYAWYNNIKPLDAVTVVFGEDYRLTSGDVAFNKGDIVRIPALYLWHLQDIDQKQTAQLLRANAVKLAVNAAALLSATAATTETGRLFSMLDLASTAYATVVSPTLKREELSAGVKELVEAFDGLAALYMAYRTGEATLQLGKMVTSYSASYFAKIRAQKAVLAAGSKEAPVLEALEEMAEATGAEVGTLSALENFLIKHELKGTAIETMLNGAGNNSAAMLMQLMSWEASPALYAALNNALGRYTGLAAELIATPNLLNLFVRLHTEFGPAIYARKLVIDGSMTGAYASMVNDLPLIKLANTDLFPAAHTIGDIQNWKDLGNYFEEQLTHMETEFWLNNNTNMLSPEVVQVLQQFKNESRDIVFQMETSINGSSPKPDLLAIKKTPSGRLDFSDVIYYDFKYALKIDAAGKVTAGFTKAQRQIVNEVKDVGYADVKVKANIFTVENRAILKDQVIRIRVIGVTGIDANYNLRSLLY